MWILLRDVQRRASEECTRASLPCHGQGPQESSIPNEPFSCPAEHISRAALSSGKGRMRPRVSAAEYAVMQLLLSLQ